MVDNFDLIRGLLDFRSSDDFYFLQILQRKKDHNSGKVNGSNNNSRLIKAYYIHSLDYFDFIKPEVVELCKLFGARAGINLNRRSYEKMALQHLRKVTDQIINKSYTKSHKAYSSVVGAYSNETDKRWIIDLDVKCSHQVRVIYKIIESIRPFDKRKEIVTLPSKSGYHLITRPFDLKEYVMALNRLVENNVMEEVPEVHKNNPTNLFIP